MIGQTIKSILNIISKKALIDNETHKYEDVLKYIKKM